MSSFGKILSTRLGFGAGIINKLYAFFMLNKKMSSFGFVNFLYKTSSFGLVNCELNDVSDLGAGINSVTHA